jgi:hypothetical protein
MSHPDPDAEYWQPCPMCGKLAPPDNIRDDGMCCACMGHDAEE